MTTVVKLFTLIQTISINFLITVQLNVAVLCLLWLWKEFVKYCCINKSIFLKFAFVLAREDFSWNSVNFRVEGLQTEKGLNKKYALTLPGMVDAPSFAYKLIYFEENSKYKT